MRFIQTLECRRLLNADVDLEDGTLKIEGTQGNDEIEVTLEDDEIVVTIDGNDEETFDVEDVERIVIEGGKGNDDITGGLDDAGITDSKVEGGQGNDTIDVDVTIDCEDLEKDGDENGEEEENGEHEENGDGDGDEEEDDWNGIVIEGGPGNDDITVNFVVTCNEEEWDHDELPVINLKVEGRSEERRVGKE